VYCSPVESTRSTTVQGPDWDWSHTAPGQVPDCDWLQTGEDDAEATGASVRLRLAATVMAWAPALPPVPVSVQA
jgi:hypothetical protein